MSTHIPTPHNDSPVDTINTNDSIPAQPEILESITTQTPWWVVSTLFHALLFALIGLMTFTVLPTDNELILVTQPPLIRPPMKTEPEKADPKHTATVLANHDPAREISNIYVPPDFKGQESVDWQTHDDIVADLVGASGIPDSLVMQDVKNPTDRPGSKGDQFHSGMIVEDALGFGGAATTFKGQGKGTGVKPGDGNHRYGRPNAAGKRDRFKKYNPSIIGRIQEWDDGVQKGLRWLAYHQEADGHWDCKKYGASNRNDTAMTSLSLLAFLGYGYSEKVGGEHKANVQNAVKWLIAHQEPNGLIRSSEDDSAAHRSGGYPMAIATLALCEAAAMANVPETRAAAQKAIDYCVNIHQAGEGSDKRGWRYTPKSEGDTSVTGWFIMALKAGKVAGLKVAPEAFDGAIKFLDSVEVKEKDGGNGYTPASHYKYTTSTEHPGSVHRLTAIGVLARQFMGWAKDDLQSSVEWFIQKGGLPASGGNGEKVDLYYWYYGSMAVFQQDPQLFKPWSIALLDATLPNQRKSGDEAGSWDPTGDYSQEWGRVGQTALAVLCLEVCYRNPRVFDSK